MQTCHGTTEERMCAPALVLDVDGVLVHVEGQDRGTAWYARLREDLGIDPQQLHDEFFRKRWSQIVSGRADLREELGAALQRIRPSVSVDELTTYWFRNHSEVDHEVLDAVTEWADRTRGRLFLATNQEKYRADYLWRNLGLQRFFTSIFYSADMGLTKSEVEFFQRVGNLIAGADWRRADILFFDDDTQNVEVAARAGWTARLFTDVTALRKALRQWPSPDLRAPAGSSAAGNGQGAARLG